MEKFEGKKVSEIVVLSNGYQQIIFEDGTFLVVKIAFDSEAMVVTDPEPEPPEDEDEEEEDDDEDEDEDEDEDDDEDEDPWTEDEIDELDREGLEELVEDEELDIELDAYPDDKKGTRKLRKAIKEELLD
jgi:hypothetical protein